MTRGERKAKKIIMFSVTTYLKNKAEKRAKKLQFRQARRTAKADGNILNYEDWLESLTPQAPLQVHTHVHSEACDHNHEHEEELHVEEQV